MLEYRLSGRQRWKYIFFPVIKLCTIIVVATIVGVAWLRIGQEQLLIVIGLAWCWVFLIHLLPLLIIANRHNHLSSGAYFVIDTVNKTYQYRDNYTSLYFPICEIEKVIKVVSPPKFDERIDILGFGYFYYWKIVLADGRTLSLSCMLLDVDDFSGKEVSLEKQLFPVPRSNHALTSESQAK